ncbi:MAG TPA: glycosyltransferase [Thermoleophilia bacterium]|nr:glycosyltransferase [Thermoleophilia bacterium]
MAERAPGTAVVHLSVVHPPDEPRIYERECRTLARTGYDVTYLVPGATPGRDEHGVRLASLPRRSRSRRWLTAREIVASLRALRPFVVHVHDPELLTLLPLLRPFVPRLVCDVHEYLAEQVAGKPYIPAAIRPVASRASGRALRWLAAWADGGVVAHDGMLRQFGPRPRLQMVVPNYPLLAHFEGARPFDDLVADRRLRLAYIGSLSRARGCTLMLDVMERLKADGALLVLGGGFASPDLEREATARLEKLRDRVRYLGRVPRHEVPRYLASADVVWIPELPNAQYSLPNVDTKIYEGAAVGLAVLTADLAGRTELVAGEGLGIAVPPTVDGHLEGVRRLAADRAAVAAMGARGRAAVRERYSWEAFEGQFVEFYDRLCAGG